MKNLNTKFNTDNYFFNSLKK